MTAPWVTAAYSSDRRCHRRCSAFIQQGSYTALFAKIFTSGFFFVYLVRSSPFNSDKIDMLVTTAQFCTLATLFFALMMKISFFESEGVSGDAMGYILMAIMFAPLVLSVYIVGNALHEACFVTCLQGCSSGATKARRLSESTQKLFDRHIRLD